MQLRRCAIFVRARALALEDFRRATRPYDPQGYPADRRGGSDAIESLLEGVAVHFPDCFGQGALEHLIDELQLRVHGLEVVLPGEPSAHGHGAQGENQAKQQRGHYQSAP